MDKLVFNKELEGKSIFLKGTGNNARGYLGDKLYEAEVVKVTKVNVTLRFKNSEMEKKLRKHENQEKYSNRLDETCNSGYACYYSEQDILDENKAIENYNKIKDLVFSTYSSCKLTLKQTEDILKILEGE